MFAYTRYLSEIGLEDLQDFGGKNASLGELIHHLKEEGIQVPEGFAVSSQAYEDFLQSNGFAQRMDQIMNELDREGFTNLAEIGSKIREVLLKGTIPRPIKNEIVAQFHELKQEFGEDIQVAVRSSATAEDLPEASFAGQQETYLNICSDQELLEACLYCYASLFTDRAIKYREDNGFDHMQVKLSIGVQLMVRSDKACSGVCFTLDPETGFRDVVMISGGWGLGENIVKGVITPDEYLIFKPSLLNGKKAIISKKIGAKEKMLVYTNKKPDEDLTLETKTINLNTSPEKQQKYVLSDREIEILADWAIKIEKHYGRPMDIEWAKDGLTEELFITQARPETVHSNTSSYKFYEYKLLEKGKLLTRGKNIGNKIVSGRARILHSPKEIRKVEQGDVLVTEITNPDWDPILKKVSAIVTDRGGRTSHAAIVAREVGAVAVVGTGDATKTIRDGEMVTVSCIDGNNGLVYEGELKWESTEIDISDIESPETDVMIILSDPDQALRISQLPNSGVGLMRLEFAISNSIGIHPMALIKYPKLSDPISKNKIDELTYGYQDKKQFFVDKLASAVAVTAAAFYPKDVIVRMSDFKTNEYANLIGGKEFEPHEENPMIGWRGASRYYHPDYREGFGLECEAMKMVRDEMGLDNVKLMIPFCRTVEEANKVIETMSEFGLKRGENGLQLYMMIEVPSNVLMAQEFAQLFDGFSIGSNDLTQLTLGIDRDCEILNDLFDTRNDSVKMMISQAIRMAKKNYTKIGLCGQAPSDYPSFAQFLVEEGIDSISFNPDALLKGIGNINLVEGIIEKEAQIRLASD